MWQQSPLPPVTAVRLTQRGPGAGTAQTCGQSCCPGEDPTRSRKAAERLPSFIATQTHLCPHHRRIKRHLSPLCRLEAGRHFCLIRRLAGFYSLFWVVVWRGRFLWPEKLASFFLALVSCSYVSFLGSGLLGVYLD